MPSWTNPRSATATLIATFALGAAPAFAAHPLATEDAATLGGAGLLEVEVASAVGVPLGTTVGVTTDVGAALHAGLGRWFDVGLSVGLGLGSGGPGRPTTVSVAPVIDAKLRLLEARPGRPGVALRAEYGLAGEDPGHDLSQSATLQLVATLPAPGLDVHLNVFGGIEGGFTGRPDGAVGGAAAVEIGLGARAVLGFEVLGEVDPVTRGVGLGGTAGLGIQLPADLVLSVGLGVDWAVGDEVALAPALGLTIPIDAAPARRTLAGRSG